MTGIKRERPDSSPPSQPQQALQGHSDVTVASSHYPSGGDEMDRIEISSVYSSANPVIASADGLSSKRPRTAPPNVDAAAVLAPASSIVVPPQKPSSPPTPQLEETEPQPGCSHWSDTGRGSGSNSGGSDVTTGPPISGAQAANASSLNVEAAAPSNGSTSPHHNQGVTTSSSSLPVNWETKYNELFNTHITLLGRLQVGDSIGDIYIV